MIGVGSGYSLNNDENNIMIGYQSGYYHTGGPNTFVGRYAGRGTTGTSASLHNTAVGFDALTAINQGDYNVAVGSYALDALTSRACCTAVGYAAGTSYYGTSGTLNAFGHLALEDCTSGYANNAFGDGALANITSGSLNVAIGSNAGAGVNAGGNIFIGVDTQSSAATDNSNTIIGYACNAGGTTANHRIVLSSGSLTGTTNSAVHIGNDSGHVRNDFTADATWDQVSDVRKKTNIEDSTLGLEFISKLRPVIFNFKAPSEYPEEWQEYDANKTEPVVTDKKIGLIAQEVKQVIDDLGIEYYDGTWGVRPDGQQEIGPSAYIIPLIKAVQELSAEVEELKKKAHNKCDKE